MLTIWIEKRAGNCPTNIYKNNSMYYNCLKVFLGYFAPTNLICLTHVQLLPSPVGQRVHAQRTVEYWASLHLTSEWFNGGMMTNDAGV